MGLQVWFPSMPWEDHCLGHCTDPVSISAEEAPGGRDRWEPRAVALRTWLQIRPALRQASLSLYPEWAYRQHSLGIQFTWISETLGCWWKTPVSFHCPSQCLCLLLKTKKKADMLPWTSFWILVRESKRHSAVSEVLTSPGFSAQIASACSDILTRY